MKTKLSSNWKALPFMAVVTTALAVSTAAGAAGAGKLPSFYVGAGLVHSELEINDTNQIAIQGFTPTTSFENNSNGVQIFAGLNIDEHLSVELGVADLGSVTLDDGLGQSKYLDMDALYFDAILSTSVTHNIDVFASAGVTAWSAYDEGDTSIEDMGLHYGAGFDFNLYGTKDRVMRVEWEQYAFDDITFKDSSAVSMSLIFNF